MLVRLVILHFDSVTKGLAVAWDTVGMGSKVRCRLQQSIALRTEAGHRITSAAASASTALHRRVRVMLSSVSSCNCRGRVPERVRLGSQPCSAYPFGRPDATHAHVPLPSQALYRVSESSLGLLRGCAPCMAVQPVGTVRPDQSEEAHYPGAAFVPPSAAAAAAGKPSPLATRGADESDMMQPPQSAAVRQVMPPTGPRPPAWGDDREHSHAGGRGPAAWGTHPSSFDASEPLAAESLVDPLAENGGSPGSNGDSAGSNGTSSNGGGSGGSEESGSKPAWVDPEDDPSVSDLHSERELDPPELWVRSQQRAGSGSQQQGQEELDAQQQQSDAQQQEQGQERNSNQQAGEGHQSGKGSSARSNVVAAPRRTFYTVRGR